MLNLQDLNLEGKKILVRVDYNVPLKPDGTISDDTRIRESLPTIQYILKHGGSVILMSHLGRPEGKPNASLSLSPCAKRLSELIHQPVKMASDCVGPAVEQEARALQPGEVMLLENLRFHAAEEKPALDPAFAKKLASLGDIYIDDAFSTAHRAHASTVSITHYFPKKSAAGFSLQKEIKYFETLLAHPQTPFHAIIGGAKISTKMGVLKALLSKISDIYIGGGMAFTFFKAQGLPIGDSIHEDGEIPHALDFLRKCQDKKINVWLPKDTVIANAFANDAQKEIAEWPAGIPSGWRGMDIGPQTIHEWKHLLNAASTIFWNGPLGVFEFSHFALGTKQIASHLATLKAITVVGGGDSVAAINQLHLSTKFSHLSTGGGASLEFIEYGHLPGIDALRDSR